MEKKAEIQQFIYHIDLSSDVSHEKYGDANEQIGGLCQPYSVEVIFGSIHYYGVLSVFRAGCTARLH